MPHHANKGSIQDPQLLIDAYRETRNRTVQICKPLEIEDYVVQPCQEVSPPKWHLGHTTWFFETMVLAKYMPEYQYFDTGYLRLFNSYYKSAGQHWVQGDRGNLSRPTVKEVYNYRAHVDQHMEGMLNKVALEEQLAFLIEVGLQHEQQHQELLFMDIKYILACNPCFPTYSNKPWSAEDDSDQSWSLVEAGLHSIGVDEGSFAFDNEKPRHRVYLQGCSIKNSSVSNADFVEFINDGAYRKPNFWLSEGWDWLHKNQIANPLYWSKKDDAWYEYTLHGLQPLDPHAPVSHLSLFEADAFANWSGCRLPTEFELEIYLQNRPLMAARREALHPYSLLSNTNQLWFWTRSQYSPYPGFQSFAGTLGEYNGKFMCNQFVLKGGCVATPESHNRATYRNFFLSHQRWMFSGIRLAKDL